MSRVSLTYCVRQAKTGKRPLDTHRSSISTSPSSALWRHRIEGPIGHADGQWAAVADEGSTPGRVGNAGINLISALYHHSSKVHVGVEDESILLNSAVNSAYRISVPVRLLITVHQRSSLMSPELLPAEGGARHEDVAIANLVHPSPLLEPCKDTFQ